MPETAYKGNREGLSISDLIELCLAYTPFGKNNGEGYMELRREYVNIMINVMKSEARKQFSKVQRMIPYLHR